MVVVVTAAIDLAAVDLATVDLDFIFTGETLRLRLADDNEDDADDAASSSTSNEGTDVI